MVMRLRALTDGSAKNGCRLTQISESIGMMAAKMESGMFPDIALGAAHWSALAGLPIIVAVIAMLTARITVMKTLSRML